MDVAAITTFVQNLGFPIACVCVMFYMLNKEREDHKEETMRLNESLHNNTLALTELTLYLKNKGNGEK